MSSYRRPKHVYNDNWEDSHPFTDLVPVTCGDDDPAITLDEDPEEDFDWDGDFLTVAAALDPL